MALFGSIAAVATVGPGPASGREDKLIEIDWNDPALSRFRARGVAPTVRTFSADDQAKLSKLRLPVLAFDGMPAIAARALGRSSLAAPKRSIAMDEADPVWYAITDEYDGITVTVTAERRIVGPLPPSAEVNTRSLEAAPPPFERSMPSDPEVPGEEGYIVEYTVYKFGKNGGGIPYTVTIECEERRKEDCRAFDAAAKREDLDLLRLIAVGTGAN